MQQSWTLWYVYALDSKEGVNKSCLVDTLTGRCKCNKDFASSNGMGAVGIRDDCGYLDLYMNHGEL